MQVPMNPPQSSTNVGCDHKFIHLDTTIIYGVSTDRFYCQKCLKIVIFKTNEKGEIVK